MYLNAIENLESIELHPADFQRYIPRLVFENSDLKSAAHAYWEDCLKNLRRLHEQNYHAEHIVGLRTQMVDHLITSLFQVCEREVLNKTRHHGALASLAAHGGYGRKEMNIYSDIDLLFLYPKKKEAYIEMLTEKILYVLWDLKIEVGYATRTISECKKLFFEDVTIMTSLLDVRYLCGDESPVLELQDEIQKALRSPLNQKKLIRKKLEERASRIQKQGGSVFVLEPNVKESAGGLRDLQTALWISQLSGYPDTFEGLVKGGILEKEEADRLLLSRNFFWKLRNELHFTYGKKTDQVTFDRQETLALKLGFKNDENGIPAVEKFMQTYYQLAYQVQTTTDALIRRLTTHGFGFRRFLNRLKTKNVNEHFHIIEGHLAPKSKSLLEKDPLKMMQLFRLVQELGLALHPDTKDQIRYLSSKIDETYRTHPEAVKIFRAMLNQYKNLGHVLFTMHDTHFLDEWMPEFKKLRCRVQHDIYHIYTIDTHSIFAVNELSKLFAGEYGEKFKFYEDVLRQIAQPELLTLGLFLHDIGKGEGGNHSVKGAEIAKRITARLQYSDEEKKAVDFLIISHLLMPHLSQRRDLEDQELIIKFALSMGNKDNLNMLLLLTWGDIRAVGPEAWTDWKGALLQRLYEKTWTVIDRGEFSKEKTQERIARVKEKILTALEGRYSKEELVHFLSLMPPRYFFAASPEDIEEHFLFYRKTQNQSVAAYFKTRPDKNFTEINVLTLNAPRVFSFVTGVMLASAVNILSFEVYPSTDGRVLLVLTVTDAQGKTIDNQTRLDLISESLQQVLTGKTKVADLIAKRKIPDYLAKKPVQKAETKIIVDNDVSAYYTVIDIYAHDRLGLLYDITRTLNDSGCYVEVSKISTKVEQVTDVFYVKDVFGHKITSTEKIKAVKQALKNVVEGQERPPSSLNSNHGVASPI